MFQYRHAVVTSKRSALDLSNHIEVNIAESNMRYMAYCTVRQMAF